MGKNEVNGSEFTTLKRAEGVKGYVLNMLKGVGVYELNMLKDDWVHSWSVRMVV